MAGTCVCQAWKPVGKNPEQGLHAGSVFSLPLPVPFSSLLGFCLFFWTLDIGPQNGEAMRLYQHQQMPSKQEGFETAMDPFGLSGF